MAELRTLPLLPLQGLIVFPYMIIHLDVMRERSAAAIDEAMLKDKKIMLVAQIKDETENPGEKDIHKIGTLAEIRQIFKLPGGAIRVLVEGLHRATVENYRELERYAEVDITEHTDPIDESMQMEALTRAVAHEFEEWVKLSRRSAYFRHHFGRRRQAGRPYSRASEPKTGRATGAFGENRR